MEVQLPENKLETLLRIFFSLKHIYEGLLKHPGNLIPKRHWTGVTLSSFTTKNFILPIDQRTLAKLKAIFGLDDLVMQRLKGGELYLPNLEDFKKLETGEHSEGILDRTIYKRVSPKLGHSDDPYSFARVEQMSTLEDITYVMVPSIDINTEHKRINCYMHIYALDSLGRPLLVNTHRFSKDPFYTSFDPLTIFLTFYIEDPIYLEDKPIITESIEFQSSPNTFSYNVRASKFSELESLPEDQRFKVLIEIWEELMPQINANIQINKE